MWDGDPCPGGCQPCCHLPGGEQGSGGAQRGGAEPPGVLLPGEVAEAGDVPGGVPVGLALGAGGGQWLHGSIPPAAAPCWAGGPGGVRKPPQVCPASASAPWVLRGARPPQRVM